MTTPSKPWETAGVNSRLANPNMDATVLSSSAPFGSSAVNRFPGVIPALPPRPYAVQRPGFGGLGMGGGTTGGYGSPYGGYGSSLGSFGGGLGGYGNSYGGYGGGFGGGYGQSFGSPYGAGYGGGMYSNMESRFIQLAEESSRPAFQSIESLVGAVSSVAMMLDSTFIAITSSFRAILGVADNFNRLQSLFAQFWSTFALIRGINWLLKKLLVFMGIRTEHEFKAWADATAAQGRGPLGADGARATSTSSWPVLMFLGVITAAPYLILKLLGSITSTIQANASDPDPSTWQNPHRALAQYDFQASSPQEISFRANQVVTIAPEAVQGNLWNSGWLMATVDNKTSGLIPANYVKLFRTPSSSLSNTNASLPTTSIPTANEKSSTEARTSSGQFGGEQITSVNGDLENEGVYCSTGDATSSLENLVKSAEPEVVDFEKCFEKSNNVE